MNYFLSNRLKEQYPEWHRQPFRLSNAEIERPQEVIAEFFEGYDLYDLRICMEELLYLIPPSADGAASFYLRFCGEVEKMMEAVYLSHQEHLKEIQNRKDTLEMQQNDGDFIHSAVDTKRNDKKRYFLDDLELSPMTCLITAFGFSGDDSIKDTVQKWLLLTMCSEKLNDYDDNCKRRENLYLFCKELQRLVEAIYILVRNSPLALGKKHLIETECYLFLTEEEVSDPYLVLNEFKRQFSLTYSRAELWHMLDAVVTYNGPLSSERAELLFDYETMLCIIKAAYLLTEPEGECDTV